ncbi:glycoside hydrolase family 57 protein [Caldisericum exile]|uniref:Glycoside hydrolase n=1 Tax=Caldisericum exile (strain DSM 21853 / NBRC 104410 / AZM16c01) TaxID=511051 RepID=A0A7U6JEY2_CALEA|nr:1,4-alpha-glucan branching protein domain-containing protein [Caldisericum exile]BAL81216.1 putative glycoside hydrolase [Caldisericum exile AZM16c01]
MKKGYLAIVLHTHLPFIKHPEEEFFIEENWLYEAITESYLPLLYNFYKLRDEGIKFKITMSLTPPLSNMLLDDLLINRFKRYINLRIALLQDLLKKEKDTKKKENYQFYFERFKTLYEFFKNTLRGNVINGFKELQNEGFIDVITCTATHEILPLETHRKIQEVQVELGVENYKRIFGKKPRGIWLGECAYAPPVSEILAKYGIEYTILDAHGLINAKPTAFYGISAPIVSKDGVAFFGRDPEASKQVWSAKEGYPGDFNYREFYKDIVYEINETRIKKYIHPAGFKVESGIKIHKITGNVGLEKKELYDRKKALEMVDIHAGNYMFNRERQIDYLSSVMDRPPIVVAPFDTELFGHWWFEGPEFLATLLRKIDKYSEVIETITLSEYIDKHPVMQVSEPAISSWGDGGYFRVWLNDNTDWIYPHLSVIGKRMINLATQYDKPKNKLQERALNMCSKELLLSESSDWAFLITVGSAVNYATEMQRFHINAFNKLYKEIIDDNIDEKFLSYLEEKDSIFPFLDYRIFKEKG